MTRRSAFRSPSGRLRRRALLEGGLAGLALASSTGCGLFSDGDGAADSRAGRTPSDGSAGDEPPALAEQVKAGTLPPRSERLPSKPLVVQPDREPGRYGGTWHTALLGPSDTAWLERTVQYEHMMRWKPDFSGIIPNVPQSVEISGSGREYTFQLRSGMRWSDGEPFTADDVLFAVNDVLLNTALYPAPPQWLLAGTEPARVEAPDPATVRFVFPEPQGLFLQRIATPEDGTLTSLPKHYLRKFHRKYNSDADALAKQAGVTGWAKLFLAKMEQAQNPDMPTLCAWHYTTALGEGSRMVVRRNPYYWKTDPAGRQLPYLDEVAFEIVNDAQVILLKATHGDFDMHCRHINTLHNKPVLARGREAGGYDFFALKSAVMNELIIALNLAHRDPALREVFQNKDFRVGLSYAINRPELIKTTLQGQGRPWQAAPIDISGFYDEELATQYTRFDLGKANEHLDRAGYKTRDADGFRLRPDGKRIRFTVEVATPALVDTWVDGMEIIKGYWAKVGIDVRVRSEDRSLFYARKEANTHDAGVWLGDGGWQDAVLNPQWYFPYSLEAVWATPWATWWTSGGREGQRPPAPARQQMALYDRLRGTADGDEQARLFKEILRIAKEQFWVIGTMYANQGFGIVKNTFHNVPASMPGAYLYPTPAPTNPEQYFTES